MINLAGQSGELRFTLEITRKDTGKVETVEMVGKIINDELTQEAENGSNSLDNGS
jgi:hypothetical protein